METRLLASDLDARNCIGWMNDRTVFSVNHFRVLGNRNS
jgi:hypothetical protein